MKVSGIICEYNPFHNGHLYHIEQTRKNGATHIVCVMSGNFVQRGDTAIMDKLERARLAVKCGADLVVELPVAFSLAPAESFATGAVWLLKSLGVVDELSFGSETGDVLALQKALSATEEASKYMVDEIVSIMDRGYTYPRALASVVDSIDENAGKILASPNNLLAVEYLKALKKFGSPMTPFTIKRSGADHDSPEASGGFMSASSVRERILEGKGGYGAYVPDVWAQSLREAANSGRIGDLRRLERVILYKVRTASMDEISQVSDMASGLDSRIYSARMAGSLEELLFTIKTKRFTMARIRRIILSLLIGITREDMAGFPPYGRILALNERGREVLAYAKGKATIPFGTSLAKLAEKNKKAGRYAFLEGRASDIYGLSLDTITSAQNDFRAKIIIDME